MPGKLTIEVGTATVFIPIKGTNAQIHAALKRHVQFCGRDTEGRTATEIGTDALAFLLRYAIGNSEAQQRIELLTAQRAALEAQIAADNDIAPAAN